MKVPFWKTYAAVAVLAALGAYVWLVESKRNPEDSGEPKEKVLALDKSKATGVDLKPASGEAVSLSRGKDGWRITAPQPAPADQGEVDSLLAALEALEVDEVAAESAATLSEYGLEPPARTITVALEGGAPLQLQLGGKTADGNGTYARVPSQPRVFTVASFAVAPLEKKPFQLRDRDILRVKRDEVKTVAVKTPAESFALAKDEAGEWGLTAPVASRAGRWPVDTLLGSLEGLRMESIAADAAADLKPFGLDAPTHTVTLGLADGQSRTLQIGAAAGDQKRFAREASSPMVVVIAGGLVDDLAKGVAELRAKRLLEVAAYDIDGIEVQTPQGPRTLVRSTSKASDGLDAYHWKRTAPDAKDLELNAAQDALFLVGGVEVAEFIDQPQAPAVYGLDAPAVKVTLKSGAKPPSWFELGQKDGAWFARRAGDAAVLKLDAAKAAELVKAFSTL